MRHPCRTRSFTALPVRPWTVSCSRGINGEEQTANSEQQIADVSRLITHGVRRRLLAIGFWPVAYGIPVAAYDFGSATASVSVYGVG